MSEAISLAICAPIVLFHCILVGNAVSQGSSLWLHVQPAFDTFKMRLSIDLAIGFLFNTTAATLLAFAGLLQPFVLAGLLIGSSASASAFLLYNWRRGARFPPVDWLFTTVALFLVLSAALFALRVPGGFWDDTMYHLPLARDYREHGGIMLASFIRFPLFPQAMEVLFAGGLTLAGRTGAQFLATFPLVILSLGAIAAAQAFTGSRLAGPLVLACVVMQPFIASVAGYANVDLALGMFCFFAALALSLAIDGKGVVSIGWLALAGAFIGAACATKYFGLPAAAILLLFVVARLRSLKMVTIFVGAAMLVGGNWYLRNLLVSGDPFHPVLGNLFGHFFWDAGDLQRQVAEQRTLQGGTGQWSELLLRKHFIVLLGLALLSWFLRKRRELHVLIVLTLGYTAFWLATTKVDRYLAPMVGTAAVLIGVAAHLLVRWLAQRVRWPV